MSGHTNRNRRNGGNSRSRNNSQRQRSGDGRAGQPKNNAPPSREEKTASERKPESGQENPRPQRGQQTPQAPAPAAGQQPPAQSDARQRAEASDEPTANAAPSERPERQEGANPRSRPPFAAAMRGQAYIPANPGNGARPGQNGQNGQNGHAGPNGQSSQNGQNGRQSANGHLPADRRNERPVVWSRDDDGDNEGAGEIPGTWRAERLNGGTDSTPHEPFRPESRGEVGPLIDTLHELFSQDRAMASRGDSARCGICYLHFPLTALEHREDEGFYVCEGCRRLLGHQRLMMVRRQQTSGA